MKKKFLWQHPSGRWYVRRQGRYLSIKAEAGTPEFDRQYWEIMTGDRQRVKTTWSRLIKDYRTSVRWTKLMPRTRADYEKVMLYLEEKIGGRNVKDLSRSDVIRAQMANTNRVRFANYICQMMVILCEHAIDLGWLDRNPARGVPKIQVPDEKKIEHVSWPDWAVERFRSQAQPIERLIFEIGIGTIQRPGDWVDFCWGDFDGENLSLRQNKTNKALKLPCTSELKTVLLEAKKAVTAEDCDRTPILQIGSGRAMSYRYMAQIMLAARKRMGLESFDQHALRYRGIQELAWSGCTDEEIKAFSGHTTDAMVRKYAGEARQVMRAKQAAAKRKSREHTVSEART